MKKAVENLKSTVQLFFYNRHDVISPYKIPADYLMSNDLIDTSIDEQLNNKPKRINILARRKRRA